MEGVMTGLLKRLFTQFSFPGGIPSHVPPLAALAAPDRQIARPSGPGRGRAGSGTRRFALARATPWRRLTGAGFARFRADDLLGIVPQGSAVPRFRDRRQEALRRPLLGATRDPRTRRRGIGFPAAEPRLPRRARPRPAVPDRGGNRDRPARGFIRGNAWRRAVHLFFGMRHPDSDFLYDDEFPGWQAEGRLSRLVTAVSRDAPALRAGRTAPRRKRSPG
jgi:sulfite reductase (NADPH) flavoprotein alpha-component